MRPCLWRPHYLLSILAPLSPYGKDLLIRLDPEPRQGWTYSGLIISCHQKLRVLAPKVLQ
jgi:hypothetical protein